jgi:hypothetical protein
MSLAFTKHNYTICKVPRDFHSVVVKGETLFYQFEITFESF